MKTNQSSTVSILVNGKKLKQYSHQGKTFIESRIGTEYTIEIKNNTAGRVLAVTSVDGLCVLTGEPCTEKSRGYIIDPYSPLVIKGFRYSDTEVGAFKFDKKEKSYAKETQDKEAQCGIIGVRIYQEDLAAGFQDFLDKISKIPEEKPEPLPWVYPKPYRPYRPWHPDDNWRPYRPTWYDNTFYCSNGGLKDSGDSGALLRSVTTAGFSNNVSCSLADVQETKGFDVGTSWGQRLESRIQTVEFKTSELLEETLIYYASRESLEEMGVPLTTEQKVAFPQAFKKYATPPKNWA